MHECTERHRELPGSLRPVPAAPEEHSFDQRTLEPEDMTPEVIDRVVGPSRQRLDPRRRLCCRRDGFAKSFRQLDHRDRGAASDHHGAVHRILELTNVARPPVARQHRPGLRVDLGH